MLHLQTQHTVEDEEEESYFVSMTDMMVGLVFIFMLLLIYFAVQYKQTTKDLTSANDTRAEILTELKIYLTKHGVPVEVNTETGVLRLPDAILFDKGKSALSPGGQVALGHLANAMSLVLPCYTFSSTLPPRADCVRSASRIDAIFIEGHTDKDPISSPGIHDNWDLSVQRATNTYREVVRVVPALETLKNRPLNEGGSEPVLSVSGYGPQRPILDGDTEEQKRQNRRIDVRFIMATPQSPDHQSAPVRAIRKGIGGQ